MTLKRSSQTFQQSLDTIPTPHAGDLKQSAALVGLANHLPRLNVEIAQ
jgi:hypothetical protein